MNVLVIGAAGFVGRALIARLAATAGIESLTLVDQHDFPLPAGATMPTIKRIGDFGEPKFRQSIVSNVQAVVMLAAVLGGAAEANYRRARRINVDATLSLLEVLRSSAQPPRVVFASSIALFGVPLPDLIDDATPARPTLIYGAQKLMLEVALEHFTRRSWLDGVALRLPGIVARPGADAQLKSAYLNQIFYTLRDGGEIALPVSRDSTAWLMSSAKVAENIVHALHVPRAELGETCALNLPCLRTTMGDLVEALQREYPHGRATVDYRPEPAIEAQFGRYPPLVAARARQLGFAADESLEALIRGAMPATLTVP